MKLCCRNLSFGYSGQADTLKNINLEFETSSINVLCGVNGCGKSTLLKCMAALLRPRTGTVELDGVPLSRISRRESACCISFLPQFPVIPPGFTVLELVCCGCFPHRQERRAEVAAAREALELAGVGAMADREVAQLSGGERQKVFMALAMAQKARFMLLDEPFSALDPGTAHEMFAVLRQLQSRYDTVIIIVLHDLNRALHYGDRIIGISQGEIAFDLPASEAAVPAARIYKLPESCRIEDKNGNYWFI